MGRHFCPFLFSQSAEDTESFLRLFLSWIQMKPSEWPQLHLVSGPSASAARWSWSRSPRALQHRASPANTDEGKTTRRSLMVQWPGVSGPRDVGHGLVGPSPSVCPHAWSWVISFEQRRSLSTKQLFFVVVIEKC